VNVFTKSIHLIISPHPIAFRQTIRERGAQRRWERARKRQHERGIAAKEEEEEEGGRGGAERERERERVGDAQMRTMIGRRRLMSF
jgi:hypothetical protein